MEYEEFEEQFINHVKYMAGWSKIQGKCVVETVMIAGNENKRIYLCDGKKLEFAGTLQDRQKVSSFKPKIR